MTRASRLVSIVLPVHNQADHIEEVVAEYEEALRRGELAYELILVENASSDASLQACNRLSENDPNVRVVHSNKGGWGHAVRLGLDAAQGDILCYANSARTSGSDLLLLVLYGFANPQAVVKPHRRSRDSWSRRIGSLLYNMEGRLLFDLPTWDINATPKVFHRELYSALDLRSDGDLLDLEFYIQCKGLNTPIIEVPIYSWRRFGGASTTTYRSAVVLYAGAYKGWQRMRRGADFAADA
jgi:glycosyltransferase involved in cell wall biosynthesis